MYIKTENNKKSISIVQIFFLYALFSHLAQRINSEGNYSASTKSRIEIHQILLYVPIRTQNGIVYQPMAQFINPINWSVT